MGLLSPLSNVAMEWFCALGGLESWESEWGRVSEVYPSWAWEGFPKMVLVVRIYEDVFMHAPVSWQQ